MPIKRRTIPRMTRAPRQQPESPIVYECLRWLLDRGYLVWRNNVGACKIGRRWMRFGKRGSSDIIGMLFDGRFLAIELKTPTGRLSPEQEHFIASVRENGGVAIVARSLTDMLTQLPPEPPKSVPSLRIATLTKDGL